ncbi:MAG: FAD-dependent oxidoreductase, partial [Lachnospiraceae bacterium]|nr:FAD-dependent oxidoreductase [Lachnospiraceae bacterium]
KGHRIPMEAKAFAVGLRIQHPQEMIDESQYGSEAAGILGPASYKLTHQCQNGRGVYSFCMCPGGFVVNASSEEGRLAVNGMSYHARDGKNANSALIVTVTPEDFASDPAGQDSEDFAGDMAGQNPKNFDGSPAGHTSDPLAGIAFQRRLEAAAFRAGGGKIPVQLYGDFKNHSVSTAFGQVEPQFEGETAFADLRSILPEELSQSLIEGVERFGGIIKGFNREDAIFAGIESRTSSPVRINRDEHFESAVNGLFPCGEGAGYAGGITSAAMDGIRIAEEVARRYRPLA